MGRIWLAGAESPWSHERRQHTTWKDERRGDATCVRADPNDTVVSPWIVELTNPCVLLQPEQLAATLATTESVIIVHWIVHW